MGYNARHPSTNRTNNPIGISMIRTVLVLAIAAGLSARAVADPARLEFATIADGRDVDGGRFAVVVGDASLAVTSPGDLDRAAVVFRRDGGEVVFIDHARHEYVVMTEAWLADAAERARAAAEATRRRLDQLRDSSSSSGGTSLDSASAMMRMMPLMGGAASAPGQSGADYRPRGRQSEYNGLVCDQFDEIVDGRKARVVCLSAAEAIGLDDEKTALVEAFLATLARMRRAGLDEFGFKPPPLTMAGETFEGIPIVATDPDSNGYLLVGPASDANGNALLEVPSNYLEAKIPLYGF